ncbi:hypothetical protein VOLCADRAFT_56845 [Volvox carteri f. nagariensis]|uniref:Threonylcarbamoyl-AMP synthase n=1 Tax=Volvox carteri f. nagariensis TaxID=3068 RepID=D8TKZ3_VOLCA|nr:uncharacterized protein VOLCADRAFT_56845 [Volvox carteri f. nagariensis]EFJ51646.1 hypothetical protein VOLCADRAFT_56845 [Volvox carteri f. nagariensis]|eukprot:XP_002947056.1 hypothetical protein VOLCADRAFT_56845 [Volvox carteri f. nagariensis]
MTAATPIPGDLQTEVLSLVPAELSCDTTFPNGQPPCHPCIARAAEALAAGEVVAIPTETVYGLAANALSACAVGRVYTAKNRPADNPLIVHVSSLDMLASLYPPGWALPSVYEAIVRDLWPGPLTILLPRSHLVPDVVTCGQSTMAVRMPAHPVALALIAACGFPLAAPSANSSGRPSPTLARHVLDDLGGRVPLILDGGACTYGVESTVLDGLRNPPAILRPGGITHEQLAGYPGLEGLQLYRRDFVDPQLEAAPSTPGMKYRHYSPNAPVLLLDPGDAPAASVSDEALAARQQDKLEEARQGDLWPQRLPPYEYVLGHVSRPAAVASELYAALRHMDEVGVAVIVVEGVRDTGAGVAVMNRLRKAASRVVAV